MLRSRFFWKLYAGFIVLILLTGLVVGILVSVRIERDALRRIDDELHDKAVMLADVALPYLAGTRDRADLRQLVNATGRSIEARLTVIGADGAVLADSVEDPAKMKNHSDRLEVLDAKVHGIGTSERYSETLHVRMRYCALPVYEGDRPLGYVRTALPLTTVDEQVGRVRSAVALGFAIAVGAALIIAFVVAQGVTRPLASMTRVAQAVAAGEQARSVYAGKRDEIGALARALNEMAAQLRERLERIAADRNEMLAILASMVEGVIAVDGDERIVHINAAAGDILRVPVRESTGRRIWEITRIREVPDAVARAINTAAGVTGEITLPAGAGDRVIELQAAPLRDAEGDLAGVVVVLHDVTRLRGLERVRRDFVANVSHEIKTPLTAIRGLVETLLDDRAMDAGTRERFLRKLGDQSARLLALVADLLTISRLESKEYAFERNPVDLRGLIGDAVRSVASAAESKRLAVSTDLPEQPLVALCDAGAVRQVLDNLLDNAVKYTPEGGRITVRARADDSEAVIEVEDTGIGIEPRDQPRIFERFYRVDTARSRELGGTGLGLSIVKHIVLAHDGEVSVESLPGRGSTFRVRLPLGE